jgi:chromate transport protein ChrA
VAIARGGCRGVVLRANALDGAAAAVWGRRRYGLPVPEAGAERKERPLPGGLVQLHLFISVAILAAIVGAITKWLPIRLFENFYRNGSIIYGGGQALVPLLFTEFVRFKKKQYLSAEEFLSGLALAQVVPGPNFSFTSFIGVLAMRDYGVGGEVLGSFMAAAGIFLPGTFLIFFVYHFWNQLKQYRIVRASLEGINAASTGMIASAAVLLLSNSTTVSSRWASWRHVLPAPVYPHSPNPAHPGRPAAGRAPVIAPGNEPIPNA